MRRVTLTPEMAQQGTLILVNAHHPLKQAPVLEELRTFARSEILLERKTALVLENLFSVLGCSSSLIPVSGWRSQKEQTDIYTSSLAENGREFTQSYVALPDCSEHQTGLAIDLAFGPEPVDFIRPYFPREGICAAFRKKMTRYGFIERYQEGKESLTGIAPEPWHFRYVGVPHAALMEQHRFCLEEYLEYLTDFPAKGRHLNAQVQNQTFEIFYQKATNHAIQVEIPGGLPFLISGDNAGGYIFTLWR